MAALLGKRLGGAMFRKYFTQPEAAKILTDKLQNTEISEIDLLLAAKDGDLILSLVFQEPPLCLLTARMESLTEKEIATARSNICLDYANGGPYKIEAKRVSVEEYNSIFDIEYMGDARTLFSAELNNRGFPSGTLSFLEHLGSIEYGGIYFKRKDCDGYFKPARFTALFPPPEEPQKDAEEAVWDDYLTAQINYTIKFYSAGFWLHEYPKTLDDLDKDTLVVRKEHLDSLIKNNTPKRPESSKTTNKQNEIIAVMAQMILGNKNRQWSKKQTAESLVGDIQAHAETLGWKMQTLSAKTLQKYIEEGEERLKQ
ncbi:MAG: hypothetical protein ACFNTM_05505 [Cardiobacterium sp.]